MSTMESAPVEINAEQYLSQVQKLGKIYEPKFHLCFKETIEEFNEKHSPMMFLYNGRDYANNFHAHLRGRIRFHFNNLPDVYIEDKPNRAFTLVINGKASDLDVWLVIRFKKITKSLRTANIPTKIVKDFFSQGQCEFIGFAPVIQSSLFPDPDFFNSSASVRIMNLPKAHNLVAGYCPDASWTNFELLGLTLPISLRRSKLMNDFTSISDAVAEIDIANFPETREQNTEKPKRVRQRQNTNKQGKQKLRKYIESGEKIIEENETKKRKVNE